MARSKGHPRHHAKQKAAGARRNATRTRTACGFCNDGLYRDHTCPYCGGSGDAPQCE